MSPHFAFSFFDFFLLLQKLCTPYVDVLFANIFIDLSHHLYFPPYNIHKKLYKVSVKHEAKNFNKKKISALCPIFFILADFILFRKWNFISPLFFFPCSSSQFQVNFLNKFKKSLILFLYEQEHPILLLQLQQLHLRG